MATIKNGTGTTALAAFDESYALKKHEFGRPKPGPKDVSIDIQYCGMCHSDLHALNGDWGLGCYPLAAGHEISGTVKAVGSEVTAYSVGDAVGVGCFVSSCRTCDLCKNGEENLCKQSVQTYGNPFPEGKGHDDCANHFTNGGYTSDITVDEHFVYAVPDGMKIEHVGPLLCSGITMFSPLNKHIMKNGGGEGKTVGIVGFGGLGNMGTKIAKAMGCKVVLLSRSNDKKDAANELGASIVAHTDEDALDANADTLDVILDTVAAPHDVQKLLPLLNVPTATCVYCGIYL